MSVTTITIDELNIPKKRLTKLEREQLSKTSFTYQMKKQNVVILSKNGKRIIAIYKRISHKTDQSVTFERQHMELMDFLKSHGIDINDPNVVVVVFQESESAYKNVHRPVLQNMVERILAGEFTDVAFYDIDRLARKQKVAAVLDHIFKEAEVKVWVKTLGKSIDTNTIEGGIIWNIMSMMAEQYSKQTSDRTTGGHKTRAKAGVKRNSVTPYGMKDIETTVASIGGIRKVYELDTDIQSDYPAEFNNKAAVVKEIYRKYNDGQSLKSITRWLNDNIPTLIKRCEDKSIPEVQTKSWDDSCVKYMLKNPVYFGGSHYKKEIVKDDKGEILITNEPLVSFEYWSNTQALLDANTRIYKSKKVRHTTSMSSLHYLAHCSCGGKLKRSTSATRGVPFYSLRCIVPTIDKSRCDGVGISQVQLEKTIYEYTKAIIENKDLYELIVDKNTKSNDDIAISAEEQKLIDEIELLNSEIEKQSIPKIKLAIQNEVANLNAELNKIRMSANIVINKVKNHKLTLEIFNEAWNKEDKHDIVSILGSIYQSIIISKSNKTTSQLNELKKEGWHVDPERVTIVFHDGTKVNLDAKLV